jgi:type 1 fimbriae regulatory protein FimB/type 1 fimbriae regulatory protein FimE
MGLPSSLDRIAFRVTRALQHFVGHRNIMHTVKYTELRADRFNGFWKD